MNKLLIYLTNLTHITESGIPANESIPLNLGYLAAYAKRQFGESIEIELFNMPSDLVEAVKRKRPHLLAGSNYSWNSNLSYFYLSYFKKRFPNIITIMGGPTFSYNRKHQKKFLKRRKLLDFYVSDEGEMSFAGFVGACLDNEMDISKIKKCALDGWHFLDGDTLVLGKSLDRIKDLDMIPSPYINGFLDKFLDNGFTPILQSNRGCPFSCAYCCSSVPYYSKVTFFGVDRVKEEIEYIAKKVKSRSIHIHDSNFGMFKQDYQICEKFKDVQEKYDWPTFISAATGKNSKGKILECIELLGASVTFSASVQTTSGEVLRNINRKNIGLDDFWAINQRLKEFGANSHSELILPLPGETPKSHLEGIKSIMSAGIDSIGPYTTMLLPGSPLYEDKVFAKFQMVTRYRVIPRDFGKYEGNNVVEVEKLCVGTKDLSLEDYLFLRGFHFVIYCYYNGETFKELFHYLKGIGCEAYDFCYALLLHIDSAPASVKDIFTRFLVDTRNELWYSENDIHEHYAEDVNFNKLLEQEEGCNLLQKCHGIFLSSHFEMFLEYGFQEASRLFNEYGLANSEEIVQSIRSYILNSRKGILNPVDEEIILELPYDIHSWKQERYIRPISDYKRLVKLKFSHSENQRRLISDYINMYGATEDGMGKILTRLNPKILFKEIIII